MSKLTSLLKSISKKERQERGGQERGEQLKKAIAVIKKFKKEKEKGLSSRLNLSGLDLSYIDFIDLIKIGPLQKDDLKGANFAKANLEGAKFKEIDLTGTDFSGANLDFADFENAELSSAKFTEAKLGFTSFNGADLRGADLTKADLRNADLENAKLSGAILYRTDLRNANLENADFSEIKLKDPNYKPTGAILQEADLRGAKFTGAKFTGANIKRVKLNKGVEISKDDFEKTTTFDIPKTPSLVEKIRGIQRYFRNIINK